MRKIAEVIVHQPGRIRLFLAVVSVLALISAAGLQFEFSPQSVYEGRDDLVDFSEEHKQLFGHEDASLVVVLEAVVAEDVLSPAALSWQKTVSDRLSEVSRVQRVSSLATLQTMRLTEPVPLIRSPEVSENIADRVRRKVQGEELIRGALVSQDLKITNLVVEFDPAARSMDETRAVVEDVAAVIADHPAPDGYRTVITGIAALRVDVVQNLFADQALMFPLCGALFLVVVLLMFRDLRITLYALGAVFVGVIWAFGIVAAIGQSFSLLSNSVPTLTLIIGAANVVHLVARHQDELRLHQGDGDAAAVATMTEMLVTCMLTFATTAIGFGSLLLSKSVILREFAFQASLGLICQYFSIVLIVGTALRGTAQRPESEKRSRWLVGLMSRMVSWKPIGVLAGSFGLVVVCGVLARNVAVDSFLYETYDSSHPTMKTIQMLDDRMSGLAALEIQLAAQDSEALFEPAVFEQVLELQASLLSRDEVRYARSYVDLHLAAGGSDRALTADNIGRFRRNIRRAKAMVRRDFFVTNDDQTARILLRVRDIGSARMNGLVDEIEERLTLIFPRGEGIRATVTGDAYLHARCMDQFVRDMFYSLLTASVAIFAVISLLFRSLRTGLISAVPNMTPLAVTLGYIGIRGYPLTAGTVIVFGITLGIAVDDTIHFLSRFREERRKGLGVDDAIHAVFQSSGRAIVLTTVLIVSGLSVLLLSQFVPTRRFAELTAVTMGAALVGDLLLLPACLTLFEKREGLEEYEGDEFCEHDTGDDDE